MQNQIGQPLEICSFGWFLVFFVCLGSYRSMRAANSFCFGWFYFLIYMPNQLFLNNFVVLFF